jgi:hypothetical protein
MTFSFQKKNLEFQINLRILHQAPSNLKELIFSPWIQINSDSSWYFSIRPLDFTQITISALPFYTEALQTFHIYKYTLGTLQNDHFAPNTSKANIFSTTISIPVILALKFSKSISLSYFAFIIYISLMHLFNCLCVFFALGNIVLEQFYEDF